MLPARNAPSRIPKTTGTWRGCRYRLTAGSKFGADFLAYPGDPSLYHGQFCVRVAPYHGPLLPALLAAACRGSHAARKHLLLASVEEGGSADGDGRGTRGQVGAGRAGGGDWVDGASRARQVGGELCGLQGAREGGRGPAGDDKSSRSGAEAGFRIHYMTIGPVEGFG